MATPTDIDRPGALPTQTTAAGEPEAITRRPEGKPSVRKAALSRAADHAAALSTDLRDWVELRIALVKTEIREKIEDVKSLAKRKAVTIGLLVVAAVLGLYALGFLFAAASAGVATLLGHPAWGHLVVGGSLLVIVMLLAWIANRRNKNDSAIEATLKPNSSSSQ